MSFEHVGRYLIQLDKLLTVEWLPGEDEEDARWLLTFNGGTTVRFWKYSDPDSFRAFTKWVDSHEQWLKAEEGEDSA